MITYDNRGMIYWYGVPVAKKIDVNEGHRIIIKIDGLNLTFRINSEGQTTRHACNLINWIKVMYIDIDDHVFKLVTGQALH